MIKYSSYTNHFRSSLHCHHNKILPKDLHKVESGPNKVKQSYSAQVNCCCKCEYILVMLYVAGLRMVLNSQSVLEPVTREEPHLVEMIHQNLCQIF